MKTLSMKNILSNEECQILIKQLDDNIKNAVHGFTSSYNSMGGASIKLKDNISINNKVKERFKENIKILNESYKYELNDFNSISFSLTKYVEGAFLPTHMDLITSEDNPNYEKLIKRKLVIITLLNEPSDFVGGELSINLEQKNKLKFEKGEAICFPAFFPHGLSKITSGERYILMVIVEGKNPFM
jgi:predicted 2-oxoglutarate/Fe(II)-dependent dioxygenase YbiX